MHKVLFVDDDDKLLAGFRRLFRHKFDADFALSAADALDKLSAAPNDYAVIISDMRMPEMTGVQLLSITADRYPDIVRIMLTGNNDQETAVDAVNKGQVFSFLNKPVLPEEMESAIGAAIDKFKAQKLERDLLERTLAGSVKVLIDVMQIARPDAFNRACLIREAVLDVARDMKLPNLWEIRLAVMLSGIGLVGVSNDLLGRIVKGGALSENEQALYHDHPAVAAELLKSVPRMENVANIISHQDYTTGDQDDNGHPIPMAAKIIAIFHALVPMNATEIPPVSSIDKIRDKPQEYDPEIVEFVARWLAGYALNQKKLVSVDMEVEGYRLLPDDLLRSDLKTSDGNLLLKKGHTLTASHVKKIHHQIKFLNLQEPIHITRWQAKKELAS